MGWEGSGGRVEEGRGERGEEGIEDRKSGPQYLKQIDASN
jgi:hypothetical protein